MADIAASIGGSLVTVELLRSHRLRTHESGVESLCAALCAALGIEEGFAQLICFAAGLHDVGKLTIAETILDKPGKLEPEEWEIMQRHAKSGHEILSAAKGDPVVTVAASVALRHHEHWDGSGYPDAMRGDDIPREARIVGLCDVYDAMRETRPYKRPFSHEEVVDTILNGDKSGRMRPGMFDPAILQVFKSNHRRFRDTYEGARS